MSSFRAIALLAGSALAKFDLEAKPLFTHEDKELHCPDRTLVHPCTTELRRFLKDEDESFRQKSLDCSYVVFQGLYNSGKHVFPELYELRHLRHQQ